MSSKPSGARARGRLRRQPADAGGTGAVAALLPAVDGWQALAAGYVGANPETGFFSPLLLQIAAGLQQAVPGLLDGHHLSYWWSFVCQHQRPGTDVHADQSDISLDFWITPDTANLEPGIGGLDVWDIAAPADWTFEDFNASSRDIHAFLRHEGARQTSFAYAENRALRAALRMTEGISESGSTPDGHALGWREAVSSWLGGPW